MKYDLFGEIITAQAVSKVVWRFNRHHHEVNYRKFKANQLIRKEELLVKPGINNYGMKLI